MRTGKIGLDAPEDGEVRSGGLVRGGVAERAADDAGLGFCEVDGGVPGTFCQRQYSENPQTTTHFQEPTQRR
jgi:hypothetical protein